MCEISKSACWCWFDEMSLARILKNQENRHYSDHRGWAKEHNGSYMPISLCVAKSWQKPKNPGMRGGRSQACGTKWRVGRQGSDQASLHVSLAGIWCAGTEERRMGEGMRRRRWRKMVLQGVCVCVSRSWGGFISCQRGVSLPVNWLQRLKVSEVSERNREAEVPARCGGRFPRALFTLSLALVLAYFTLLSFIFFFFSKI